MAATKWAWRQIREQDFTPVESLVLLRVADHADADGACWPGTSLLAEWTGRDEKSVRRAIDKLDSRGLISRERRAAESGRGRLSDRLVLALDQPGTTPGRKAETKRAPRPVETADQPDISSRPTGHPVPTNRTFDPDQPDISSRPLIDRRTNQEPSKEPPREPSRPGERPPTDDELRIVFSLITAFGTMAQQRFNPDNWTDKVVACLRANPDLTEKDHLAIIRANFANPWWKNQPTPSVLYSRPSTFDAAIAKWRGGGPVNSGSAGIDQAERFAQMAREAEAKERNAA